MDAWEGPETLLYRRLKDLRFALPLVLSVLVVGFELFDQLVLHEVRTFAALASDILGYGVLGPAVACLALSKLAAWIRERDEAAGRLRLVYEVSLQIAEASDLKSLELLALEIPERIFGPVETSLWVRDVPNGPWRLSATRNQARPAPVRTVSVPLSNDRPPQAMLHISLNGDRPLSPSTDQLLKSVAGALAVAMDRARLRSRDLRVLDQIQQAARRRETGAATLGRMLAEIGATYEAEAAAVFLAELSRGSAMPLAVACWPDAMPSTQLAEAARQALQDEADAVVDQRGDDGYITVVPLVADDRRLGVMALASQFPYASSQLTLLGIAAGLTAMVVRNDRLSAALERQAVLEERYRLAREVHDGLAQTLGLLSIKVQLVESLLRQGRLDAVQEVLREVRDEIASSNTDVRLTVFSLRSPAPASHRLADYLRDLTAAFAARSGLGIHFESGGELDLAPEAATQLVRVVQEALTNVHRHAHARQVWVGLQAEPGLVRLEVRDDGAGFQKTVTRQRPPGFGLDIIQERLESVGGRLRLESTPGKGVVLQATIPTRRVTESIRDG